MTNRADKCFREREKYFIQQEDEVGVFKFPPHEPMRGSGGDQNPQLIFQFVNELQSWCFIYLPSGDDTL